MGIRGLCTRVHFWRFIVASTFVFSSLSYGGHFNTSAKNNSSTSKSLSVVDAEQKKLEKTVGNKYDFSAYYAETLDQYSHSKSNYLNPNNIDPDNASGNYSAIATSIRNVVDKIGCDSFSQTLKEAGKVISFRGPQAFGKNKNASQVMRNVFWSVLQSRYPRAKNQSLYDATNLYLSTIFDMYLNLNTQTDSGDSSSAEKVNAAIDNLISNFESKIKDGLDSKKYNSLQSNLKNCSNPVKMPDPLKNDKSVTLKPEEKHETKAEADKNTNTPPKEVTKEGTASAHTNKFTEPTDPLEIPKSVHSGSPQAEHEKVIDEYINRSVKSLTCDNSRNVILHNGLKMARLMAEHEKSGAIVMGDNDKSGINYVLRQNILRWCMQDQRESRPDRIKKCLETYYSPMKELTAYLYSGLKAKSGEVANSQDMDNLVANEANDPDSTLNQLLAKVVNLPKELEVNKGVIKLKCSASATESPYADTPINPTLEATNKYDKEKKPKPVVVPDATRPERSNRVVSMLPKISEGSADASEKAKSHGYYTYKDGDNYLYGRPHIVWNIQKAASNLAAQDIVIGIGDMSKAGGGDIPNHSTHEEGKAADIRLVFSNGSGGGRSRSGDVSELTDADRALNLKVIKELIDADPTNVSDIYVNDKKLQDDINTYLALKTGTNKKIRELGKKITSIFQCRRCDGHNDHIHFEWKE